MSSFKLFGKNVTPTAPVTSGDLVPLQNKLETSTSLVEQLCARTDSNNHQDARKALNDVTSVFKKFTAPPMAEEKKENVSAQISQP
jgi:hypothetical protein